jgi:hypothetical protein
MLFVTVSRWQRAYSGFLFASIPFLSAALRSIPFRCRSIRYMQNRCKHQSSHPYSAEKRAPIRLSAFMQSLP